MCVCIIQKQYMDVSLLFLFKVERYSISGLHNTAVTAVEWSKNGMKLFSGDKDGLVVLTEIDFYMVSRSLEIFPDSFLIFINTNILTFSIICSIYLNHRNC